MYAGGQVAMDKKRFRNNASRPLAPLCGFLEIAVHLPNKEVASAFFQFIKDHGPLGNRVGVFEEIIEPLKKERIVFAQNGRVVPDGRCIGDNTGETAAAKTGTNIEDIGHIGAFGLSQGNDLPLAGTASMLQALPSETRPLLDRELWQHPGMLEGFLFENFLALEFSGTMTVPDAKVAQFRLLNRLDQVPEVPIFHCHAGKHLIGRFPPVLPAFVDKEKVAHRSPPSQCNRRANSAQTVA